MNRNKTIIIGIGNSGRQDDGLGWLFLDFLKEEGFKNIDLEYRYQLQIEDAELISHYDTVVFVDASKEITKNGYYYKVCKSSNKHSFSTHELVPETILYLAEDLYNKKPDAHILGIQGYKWELQMGLSKVAKNNFQVAKAFFKEKIAKSSV